MNLKYKKLGEFFDFFFDFFFVYLDAESRKIGKKVNFSCLEKYNESNEARDARKVYCIELEDRIKSKVLEVYISENTDDYIDKSAINIYASIFEYDGMVEDYYNLYASDFLTEDEMKWYDEDINKEEVEGLVKHILL